VREVLCGVDGELTKILVTHHPFMALEKLADCGVDVLVAGHLHATRAAEIGVAGVSALMVQAGTATSHRRREEPNSFNLLRIRPQRIEVEHYALRGGGFVRAAAEAFSRQGAGGWTRNGPLAG
jgi:predicted phosphodiesterase